MSETYGPTAKRRAVLRVSADFLIALCQGQGARACRVVADPLPDDVKVVAIAPEQAGYTQPESFLVLLESESFAPVEPSQFAPHVLSPTFEIVRDDDLCDGPSLFEFTQFRRVEVVDPEPHGVCFVSKPDVSVEPSSRGQTLRLTVRSRPDDAVAK
jgi:hypothetical protein